MIFSKRHFLLFHSVWTDFTLAETKVYRSRRFRFEFHLTSLKGAPMPFIIFVSIVTIQTRMVTVFIPPSSSVVYSTVPAAFVIIPVLGTKSHAVMNSKSIFNVTRIKAYKQCVVSCLVSNCKIIILGIFISIGCCVNFHSQLTRNLSQLMNLFVSKPILSSDVAKAALILVPVPVESNKPIEAFMKDSPSTSISLHVTEHFKTSFVRWVDCVHSTFLEASRKQLGTVSGWRQT